MRSGAAAAVRVGSRQWPRVRFDPPFFMELFATCVLLALLYRWTLYVAPQVGLYATANLLLLGYSYFAVARAVYLRNHAYDPRGYYVATRKAKALQDFNRLFRAQAWTPYRRFALGAGVVTLAIDLMTRPLQWQIRNATVLPITLGAVLIWLVFGPRFIMACAGWGPVSAFNLAEAKALIQERPSYVRFSFMAMAGLIAIVSITALQFIEGPILAFIVATLPNALLWHGVAVAVMSAVAAFCLSGQATWSHWLRSELVKASRKKAV
jgi:hypothetical protein